MYAVVFSLIPIIILDSQLPALPRLVFGCCGWFVLSELA